MQVMNVKISRYSRDDTFSIGWEFRFVVQQNVYWNLRHTFFRMGPTAEKLCSVGVLHDKCFNRREQYSRSEIPHEQESGVAFLWLYVVVVVWRASLVLQRNVIIELLVCACYSSQCSLGSGVCECECCCDHDRALNVFDKRMPALSRWL